MAYIRQGKVILTVFLLFSTYNCLSQNKDHCKIVRERISELEYKDSFSDYYNSSCVYNSSLNTKQKDSVKFEPLVLQGVDLELLGKNGLYSIGYEYQLVYRRHSMGLGTGISFKRNRVTDKKYSNFAMSISPFYEYGDNVLLRLGINAGLRINPVMFSDKFDELYYSDKPPVYILTPSVEVGCFYRTNNNRFQIGLSSYLIYQYFKYVEREDTSFKPWIGLSFKYNFNT